MQRIKVCAIDNDKSVLFLLRLLLKRIDKEAEYITFNSGVQAFDFFQENANNAHLLPDIVLLDLNMEEMNGWAFLEAYEKLSDKINHRIHIYIHSSSKSDTDIDRANQHKLISEYLDKPIDEDKFSSLLDIAKARKN